MDSLAFHAVLSHDAVEVACDDAVGLLVLARRLVHVDGTAHEELAVEGLFEGQWFLLFGGAGGEQAKCSKQ